MVTRKAGYQPKVRNTGTRERKKLLIISAEGRNKTETLYFKCFSDETRRVIFARGNDTDPVQIAQHLKDEILSSDFDSGLGDLAYALVDHDLKINKDAAIQSAEKLLNGTGGELIVSNPCFELWYLAHVRFTTKRFSSSQDVIDDLDKELGGYRKEDPSIYLQLKDRMNQAVQNAQKMERHCNESGYIHHQHDFSPSTDVYKIILEMRRQSG